jgi:uncharacterized protein
MPGLSFREFLAFETGHAFKPVELAELLNDHVNIAREVNEKAKPLLHFNNYLNYGYFSYYRENLEFYHQKVPLWLFGFIY